jgi:signal transduction histidine kinase
LGLAKIESKTYGEEFVTEDLVPVVEQFYTKNRHLFEESQINIQNPSGESFSYPISLSLFEMLLMNLFTNAIKYNESDIPRLNVVFERRHRTMAIHFEDNGIGLPKSEIKKIFKKFYQIGRSDDMSAKGTGLGLHLAENIARIHKGKIVAESKEGGGGSVFSLILPFKPSRANQR